MSILRFGSKETRSFFGCQKIENKKGSKSMQLPMQKLQINPKHPLIVRLAHVHAQNAEVAKIAVEQLFDNALVTAGLMDDSRMMLPRINKILEKMVGKKD
jgi:TNF receptor-associated protein 1